MLAYPVLNNKSITNKSNAGEPIYDLLQQTFVIPEEFEYQVMRVTHEYIARPDLLSLSLYGVTTYADVICKLNGISNPFEMNEGMFIVVPLYGDVDKFYDIPDSGLYDDFGDEANAHMRDVKNMQKSKNAPRKANEQIIGDTNFRIDRHNKVVIY